MNETKKRVIEGYTSNQEVYSACWISQGKAKVYQLACNIYESEKMAREVYGKKSYRKVRLIMQEIKKEGG